MYATIGKCLVEFVANAVDSEATTVDIVIPTGDIQSARADAKARAKDEVEKLKRDPFTVLLTPLPDDIAITITDNGHGMSPDDVEKKLLPLNRKRRLDDNGIESNVRSESEIGRGLMRKSMCKYVYISEVAGSLLTIQSKIPIYTSPI